MADDLIPLADAVSGLRKQLYDALVQAEDEKVVFEVGAIEIALTGVISREGGAGGNASFKVLGVGAEFNASGKVTEERTHKLTFTLKPFLRGENGELSDRPILVSDSAPDRGVK